MRPISRVVLALTLLGLVTALAACSPVTASSPQAGATDLIPGASVLDIVFSGHFREGTGVSDARVEFRPPVGEAEITAAGEGTLNVRPAGLALNTSYRVTVTHPALKGSKYTFSFTTISAPELARRTLAERQALQHAEAARRFLTALADPGPWLLETGVARAATEALLLSGQAQEVVKLAEAVCGLTQPASARLAALDEIRTAALAFGHLLLVLDLLDDYALEHEVHADDVSALRLKRLGHLSGATGGPGNWSQVRQQCESWLAEGDQAVYRVYLARALMGSWEADVAAAKGQLEQALTLAPDLAEAHLLLALWHREHGQAGQARAYAAEAVRLAPADPMAGFLHRQLRAEAPMSRWTYSPAVSVVASARALLAEGVYDPHHPYLPRTEGGRELAWQGSWSPDGKHGLYMRGFQAVGDATYFDSLWYAQGAAPSVLTPVQGGQPHPFYEAIVWEPHSRWAAVIAQGRDGMGDVLQLFHAGHGTLTLISAQAAVAEAASLAWSPDGNCLAFIAREHPLSYSKFKVWVVEVGGAVAEPRLLTQGRFHDRTPAWSPAGTRLAFSRSSNWANDPADIWVVDVAAGTEERLTVGYSYHFHPFWVGNEHVGYSIRPWGAPAKPRLAVSRLSDGARVLDVRLPDLPAWARPHWDEARKGVLIIEMFTERGEAKLVRVGRR